MTKPPKSPLEKPASGHSRRPSGSRRANSSEVLTHPLSSSKHGLKFIGHALTKKAQPTMPASPTTAEAPTYSGSEQREEVTGFQDDKRPYVVGAGAASVTMTEVEPSLDGVTGTQDPGRWHHDILESRAAIVRTDSIPSEEIDRLKAAMNVQLSLSQQRERPAKHLNGRQAEGRRDGQTIAGRNSRVSPIHEEVARSPTLNATFGSPENLEPETTSTESIRTIRGESTRSVQKARTPSYPFPSMKTPAPINVTGHRPFTTLSPTVAPATFSGDLAYAARDRWASGTETPISSSTFTRSATHQDADDPNFPSPDINTISLKLSAEPGLDAWWTTVIHVMQDIFQADRVALAVPADSTDVENVPWGQKATFNVVEEDKLSLAYLPRGSSYVPSVGGDDSSMSGSTNPTNESLVNAPQLSPPARPGLQSRHSFTAYEERDRVSAPRPEGPRENTSRPTLVSRSKSYLQCSGGNESPQIATPHNTEPNLLSLGKHLALEDAKMPTQWDIPDLTNQGVPGRVFPILQALDYEADPLIDSSGVLRVLKRGKLVVLTRDYPYLSDPEIEPIAAGRPLRQSKKSKESPSVRGKRPKASKTVDMVSRMSAFLGGSSKAQHSLSRSPQDQVSSSGMFHENGPSQPPTRYEEYEQTPQSPWEQSPAPSPAVRSETDDNPFFASAAEVDTASFDPAPAYTDYAESQQLEAIAIDRSYTVVHIPLDHILLSKPVQSFRLDTTALESKTINRGVGKNVVTEVDVPAGKMAERDKTKLQHQEAGSTASRPKKKPKEKRTPIAILSFLTPVIPYPVNLQRSLEKLAPHLATSFNLCRHHTNLEAEVAGLSRKRPHMVGFGAVARPLDNIGNPANTSYYAHADEPGQQFSGSITSPSDYSVPSQSTACSPAVTPGWEPGSIGLTVDRRFTGGSPGVLADNNEGYFSSRTRPTFTRADTGASIGVVGARRFSNSSSPSDARQSYRSQHEESQGQDQNELLAGDRPDMTRTQGDGEEFISISQSKQIHRSRDFAPELLDTQDLSPSMRPVEGLFSPHRQGMRAASIQRPARQERTHTKLHSGGVDLGVTFPSIRRAGGTPGPVNMLPPSDRLKTLMLDTLPVHVFVAAPHTGEIVWVNNPFLTYRGQTVAQLYEDAWGSIHPDEREAYIAAWSASVRTGQPFSRQVRIRRFDGNYRWFYARAVAGKDTKNVIVQWYGSFMDIHDQHLAEVAAARREEMEASEANYRLLANLIPQIIFAASEEKGVIFANEQWLAYTGQEYKDALETGFMDYIHPEDLEKCHIPFTRSEPEQNSGLVRQPSSSSSGGDSVLKLNGSFNGSETSTQATMKAVDKALSRTNSSSSSKYELSGVDLAELAKSGIIKVSVDSNGRQSYTTEVRLRSRTGEYRWHLVRCVEVDSIKFGNGEGSWFGACTDINDHKLLEAKLKEAMESKSKFLSNMSHEIRTPLIGISGMVDFLQDTVLNEEQLDYAGTIKTSANCLLSIINDILDLSKVDAGMMKLSFEWFHTRSLIEEANELLSTMAIQKRLELNYVVKEDVPAMVKGDKTRIRQVLLNVIGNAIKFTTEGEVFSQCTVYRDPSLSLGDSEIMLEYTIIDTGRGFTEEEAELMFKPFSQIDGSSTRQHGGSGLGLVISRQLVELHGGKMNGSAIPDKGSTFTFTAKFGLPTANDYPETPLTPVPSYPSTTSSVSLEVSARAVKMAGGNPIISQRFLSSTSPISPKTDANPDSPAVSLSGSPDPSLRFNRTYGTDKTSISSIHPGLAYFSEAARASGQDLSNLKIALPERGPVPADSALTQELTKSPLVNNGYSSDVKRSRPPTYCILVVCPQTHSREATTSHIEQTLPKDVPHQITAMASVFETQKLIGGDNPIPFTHIVLNLSSPEEIIALMDQIFGSTTFPQTSIVILSDPIQRQAILKMATTYGGGQLARDNRVTFIYKPVKPSKLAVIFDPDKERELSTDRNRSNAQQQVADQKRNYLDVEKRLGNKGYKIMLVEDNQVNRKVLLKFLQKVGIEVEIALDGVECTEKVFSQPHDFYSLILCDLHMPRKDGYQTCRDIRNWERKNKFQNMPLIALSANVMADVLDKCVAAGFNEYVTKPVNFRELSTAMSTLLDPANTDKLMLTQS